MERSEQIEQLAEALAVAQGQIETAKKDSTNPYFKSKYADLASVFDAIRKPLADNGLSIVQIPTIKNLGVELETSLIHSSGQYITGKLQMPFKEPSPHAIGSAITYARRYSLQSIVGVCSDEDDDGNFASGNTFVAENKCIPNPKTSQTENNGLITEAQIKLLFATANGKSAEAKEIIANWGYESSRLIRKKDFENILAEIKSLQK